jgi:hypothetical protein
VTRSGRFANNTRLLVTSLALNEVRLVDTTDPTSIKTIQVGQGSATRARKRVRHGLIAE